MIYTNISYMERKNFGNYEHGEITLEAKVEEGEDIMGNIIAMRATARAALNMEGIKYEESKQAAVKVSGEHAESNPVQPETSPTPAEKVGEESATSTPARRTRKPKTTTEKVEKEEAPKTNYVKYDINIPEHKQLLSSYLTKHHTGWQDKGKSLKPFSQSLVGKDFLDDKGLVVDSFKKVLSDFFNA